MDLSHKAQFIKLFDKYYSDIYRFLRIKLPTDELAQDMASETFTKAWDALAGDNGGPTPVASGGFPSNPRAYLYRIARNTLIDYYRKKDPEFSVGETATLAYMDIDNTEVVDTGTQGTADNLSITGDMQNVRKALGQMSEYYSSLITLRYIDELDNSEIAEVLGKNESAVRTGLHRALKELKDKLE